MADHEAVVRVPSRAIFLVILPQQPIPFVLRRSSSRILKNSA
jgi:hypothetical protein